MVAVLGGALRRPRPEGIRLLGETAGIVLGSEERPGRQARLRLPQTGLADRLLLDRLRGQGLVDSAGLIAVQAAHLRDGVPALDQLVAYGVPAETLLSLTAEAAGTEFLSALPMAEAGLVDRLGLQTCLSRNLSPLSHSGGAVVIATAHPTEALRHARMIRQRLGPFRLVLAAEAQVTASLLAARGQASASSAHSSVEPLHSCRSLGHGMGRRWLLAVLALLAVAVLAAPILMLTLLTLLAVLLLAAVSLLRGAALWAAIRFAREQAEDADEPDCLAPQLGPPEQDASLPLITVLVPLLREERIAERLVRRLTALNYPHDRLEILLIVEARDRMTQAALARTALPARMRVVTVPHGPVKTKPRALNYAMAQSRGSIIGVYDAEDAPDPDQLALVAREFAKAPPDVVCLQGALDFYNPQQSLLTRLFTMDYASWFRVILPGMARLGLVLPLGGHHPVFPAAGA